MNKSHRNLSIIKRDLTDCWLIQDPVERQRWREKYNAEFLAAEAAGTPWEDNTELPCDGEIKLG